MKKLRPWLICAWFIGLFAIHFLRSWSVDPNPLRDFSQVFLDALSSCLSLNSIFTSIMIVILLSVNWKQQTASKTSTPTSTEPRFERLGAKDFRVLIAWILFGALGVFVAWHYYFQAFPEASINFQVSRDEALNRAKSFLTQQGASLDGYESTIVFSVDDNVKTYLERTVGLEQANKLMSTEVNAWHWEIRFFRPQQKEEFRADVNPEGRIVGYEHIVEEARAGASLERDAAQQLAAKYLNSQYGADLAQYDFLPEESNPTERPNRRDWSFTWQLRGFRAPDNSDGAPYRLNVSVDGDQIGGATEFLKVPEAWQRDFQRMRSRNDLIESIAIIPYMLLLSAAFWFIFELSRRGGMRWSSPLSIGIFFALLWFFMSVCNWPLIRAEYDTNSSYSAFALGQIAYAALLSIVQALLVTIAVAPGEPLYRVSQPVSPSASCIADTLAFQVACPLIHWRVTVATRPATASSGEAGRCPPAR